MDSLRSNSALLTDAFSSLRFGYGAANRGRAALMHPFA